MLLLHIVHRCAVLLRDYLSSLLLLLLLLLSLMMLFFLLPTCRVSYIALHSLPHIYLSNLLLLLQLML